MEKLSEHVPVTTNFNIGYFEGKQTKKRWIYCQADVDAMYNFFKPDSEVLLWCDAKCEDTDDSNKSRKRKHEQTRREEKEQEVDDIFSELQDKHSQSYEIPKLRLWARMMVSGLHSSTDEPPAVPAFKNVTPKRTRTSSIGEAVTDAAEAIVKYMGKQTLTTSHAPTDVNESTNSIKISPSEVVDLRMKNFEQLRYLQTLYDDHILTQEELTEQKKIVLDALRKLS